jgi:hypothetical protein
MPEKKTTPELRSAEPAQPATPNLEKLIADLTVTRAADYKTIYSNLFGTRIGGDDITIIFSRLTHSPSILANANILEEQVEIVMSWSQLKMFEQTLRTLVDAIDQEIGEIKIPTGFKINPEGQRGVIRGLGYPPIKPSE